MKCVANTSFLDPENLGLDPLLAPLSCKLTILEQYFSFGIMEDSHNALLWPKTYS